ncbi:unnamed protein product [Rhizoctonia solani]|uniref:Uncharacterized protein n=1 Tax=Rhizoctonia solani TaxID=456999 RepID=A0A8H3BYF9_9AGAM|nr:unnamed protein product [Rhizoctonia solani]
MAEVMNLTHEEYQEVLAIRDRYSGDWSLVQANDALEKALPGPHRASLRLKCANWLSDLEENNWEYPWPEDILISPPVPGGSDTTKQAARTEEDSARAEQDTSKGKNTGKGKAPARTAQSPPNRAKKVSNTESSGKEGRPKRKLPAQEDQPHVEYHPSVGEFVEGEDKPGDTPELAIDEAKMDFMGDVEDPGPNHLHIRAITNFMFVDKNRKLVPVALGPGGEGQKIVYLIGCCASLNLETEAGQRIAIGEWNSDPDPEKAKWKTVPQMCFMKIPVRWIGIESNIHLRDEELNLLTVDGDLGAYVLQCPDPDYRHYWDQSLSLFPSQPVFVGIDPRTAQKPTFFDQVFWDDLKDEKARWDALEYPANPPSPPAITNLEKKVLGFHGNLVYYEAEVRQIDRNIKGHEEAIQRLQESTTPKRQGPGGQTRKTVAAKAARGQISQWQKAVHHMRERKDEAEQQVGRYRRDFMAAVRLLKEKQEKQTAAAKAKSKCARTAKAEPKPTRPRSITPLASDDGVDDDEVAQEDQPGPSRPRPSVSGKTPAPPAQPQRLLPRRALPPPHPTFNQQTYNPEAAEQGPQAATFFNKNQGLVIDPTVFGTSFD